MNHLSCLILPYLILPDEIIYEILCYDNFFKIRLLNKHFYEKYHSQYQRLCFNSYIKKEEIIKLIDIKKVGIISDISMGWFSKEMFIYTYKDYISKYYSYVNMCIRLIYYNKYLATKIYYRNSHNEICNYLLKQHDIIDIMTEYKVLIYRGCHKYDTYKHILNKFKNEYKKYRDDTSLILNFILYLVMHEYVMDIKDKKAYEILVFINNKSPGNTINLNNISNIYYEEYNTDINEIITKIYKSIKDKSKTLTV
jgi:hypothetical protein